MTASGPRWHRYPLPGGPQLGRRRGQEGASSAEVVVAAGVLPVAVEAIAVVLPVGRARAELAAVQALVGAVDDAVGVTRGARLEGDSRLSSRRRGRRDNGCGTEQAKGGDTADDETTQEVS